jgi:serine/threonine protein kinase/WD40 repeat protein
MSAPHDESDEKMEVLGQFLEELPRAADAEAVVRAYALAHPQWARDFVEEAVVGRLLTAARADAACPDLTGLTDFEVLRGVAAGGMGVVYEAVQVSLGRRVALKVRYGPASPERVAAFEREQRALARLHQSHIVPIYQSGRCGAWQYFAMAYIDGATLHQVIRAAREQLALERPVPALRELVALAKRHADDPARLAEFAEDLTCHTTRTYAPPPPACGPASPTPTKAVRLPAGYFRAVAGLMADAAEAVAHAHAAGVIHRDLKPSNVMIDLAGQCWIIDFGLAGAAQPADGTGAPAGTPGYIAPEHFRPDARSGGTLPADVRSDVWALGATLFEALMLHRAGAGGPPGPVVSNVPADLEAICRKALQHDPDRRYPTADELARDLRYWLAERPTSARPVPPWRATALWARRNKGWAAALGCAGLLVVACAVFLTVRADHRAERAELQTRAAEDRASDEREKARLHERENWLHDVRGMQQAEARNGWSVRAWELLRRANEVHSDARVRDLAVGTLRGLDAQPVKQFPFGSSSVAFAPDGRSLLIGGLADLKGRPVRPAGTWVIGSDDLTDSTRPGEGPVAFDGAGRPLQLVAKNGELLLWDIAAKTAAWRAPLPDGKIEPEALFLSGDAGWVAASTPGGRPRTRVWKVPADRPALEREFAADAVAFSGAREFVALADNFRRRIVIHSLETGELVAELPTGSVPVRSLAFGKNPRRSAAPPGRYLLAAGDAGGTVAVWDLTSRTPVSYCRGISREVDTLAFHPDGTLLATGGREEVQLWEVASGKPCLRIRPDAGLDYVTQVAFSPGGDRLAVSSRGVFAPPSTTVWALENGRGLSRLVGLSGQVETVVVSPDGGTVAALARNWELGVWDARTGHLRHLLDVPPGAFADNAGLAFSPDGRALAYSAGTLDRGTALLLDVATGAELRRWELPPGLQNHFGFDGPDRLWHFQVETRSGEALPTSARPWEVDPRVGRLRNLKSGDRPPVVAEVRDFPRGVLRAKTTPDGRYTLMEGVGEGRAVKVVENATGRVTATLPSTNKGLASNLNVDSSGRWAWFPESAPETTTRFSIPDGRVLSTGGVPIDAGNAAAGYSCRLVHRNPTGCLLFRADGDQPLADLAPGATVNAVAFDPGGRVLVWGGRDGSVTVCHLELVRERLKSLALAW